MTLQALADLHARCFEVPRPFSATEFVDLLASKTVFLCPHPAGFAVGRCVLDEAELLTLAVHPSHRRMGVGTKLLRAFETEARERGARQAFLEVAADNLGAHAMYAAGGYERTGLRRGYYRSADGVAVDAIVMSRRFSQV